MHQRDQNQRDSPENPFKEQEEFDANMVGYLEQNFIQEGEDNETFFKENKYSKATYELIFRTLIIQGHIDIIEGALNEEEEGINPEDEQHIKYVEALKNGYSGISE